MNYPNRIVFAVIAGFLVAVVTLFADYFRWKDKPPQTDLRHYLLTTPKGNLWVFLVWLQSTSWFIALFEFGRPSDSGTTWTDRKAAIRSHKAVVAVIVFIMLALPVCHLFWPEVAMQQINHYPKILVFTLLALAAVLLVATEFFRIEAEFDKLAGNAAPNANDLTHFCELREKMDQLLLLLGVSLSLLALGTGAFRNSWNAITPEQWKALPGIGWEPFESAEIEGLLCYCGIFSLPILLLYVPVYFSFRRTARKLADYCLTVPIPAVTQLWFNAMPSRSEVEKAFQIDTEFADRSKSAIIILSPVLTVAVSLLLPSK